MLASLAGVGTMHTGAGCGGKKRWFCSACTYLDELLSLGMVDEQTTQVSWQHIQELMQVILDHHLLLLVFDRLCRSAKRSMSKHMMSRSLQDLA